MAGPPRSRTAASGVEDPVGADLAGVLDAHRQPGAGARLHDEVAHVGDVPGQHLAPLVQHGGHRRAHGDGVDLAGPAAQQAP